MTTQPRPMPQTFRAVDMPAALEEIQRVLGPEALIVSVRPAATAPAWQVWKKPGVEVVALGAKDVAPATKSPKTADAHILELVAQLAAQLTPAAPARPAPPASPAKPAPVTAATPLASAATLIPAAARASTAQPALPPAAATGTSAATAAATAIHASPVLSQAYAHLLSQGLDLGLARKIVNCCADTIGPEAFQDAQRVRWHLEQQLEACLHTQSSTALAAQHVVCLIGATGAGKTTAVARLAHYYSRHMGASVAWIAADTMRAGAIAQARAFAEALKLPLRVAYGPEELAQAVAAEEAADLVLVDLPGCNPRSEAAVTELGSLLAALPRRGTYWVASAAAKDEDLTEGYAAFAPFRLNGLLVTKLDETGSFGPVVNLAWRGRLPLTFFGAGPRVLDTLQPAQPETLVKALFEGEFRP